MAQAVATTHGPSYRDWQAFFDPGLALARRYDDPDYRFAVVPLAKHWDAYFFPLDGYSLAQGWYRQSDAIHDMALRRGGTRDAARYAAWPRSVAVKYVFVGRAALEPDARGLPRLLASSSQFVQVAGAGRWTVYRVTYPEPILTTTAGQLDRASHVVRCERTELVLRIARAGDYRVKDTWSPYWSLAGGPGRVWRASGDWADVRVDRAGLYRLRSRASVGKVLGQLL